MLICFGVAAVCFLIAFLLPKPKPKIPAFYSIYTPNGLLFIKRLEELWQNNESIAPFSSSSIYEEMFGNLSGDTSKKVDSFYSSIGLDDYVNITEGTLKFVASEYYSNLEWDLSERYRLQFQKLEALNSLEAMQKYNVNLHNNEILDYCVRMGVDWLEEKTITTSYDYGGYRFRTGNRFSYTFGSLSVLKNTVDRFVTIDRGELYITNERIIFLGTQRHQSRTILFDDILSFSIFQNGILLGKANGRQPLLQFGNYTTKNSVPTKCDDLNKVVRVLERVLNKTQFENIIS